MSEENVIFEKYLTEIAFSKEHEPVSEYFVVFWMAENHQGTVEAFAAKNIDNAATLIDLNGDKKDRIKEHLEKRTINLFYSIEKHKDSDDITLILVGLDPNITYNASIALDTIYQESKPQFFQILKVNGFKVR